ncbi:hypothetical protein Hanom_Chr17g01532511 [Helianthus anomalus]
MEIATNRTLLLQKMFWHVISYVRCPLWQSSSEYSSCRTTVIFFMILIHNKRSPLRIPPIQTKPCIMYTNTKWLTYSCKYLVLPKLMRPPKLDQNMLLPERYDL